MSLPRAAAFCWTGDARDAAFFLEEALAEWAAVGAAFPLLVDCQPKKDPDLLLATRPGRGLPSGELRLLGEAGVPYCRASALPQALKDAERKGKPDYFEGKSLIFIPGRDKALALAEFTDEFLFLGPAAKETVSALYNFAISLNGLKGRSVGISLVVSGLEKIESAAEFFFNAKEELSKLALLNAEFRFVGHLHIPPDKAKLSKESGKSYRHLFAQDGTYGQLKAIGRRWLPNTAPASGCDSLAALAERIAARA